MQDYYMTISADLLGSNFSSRLSAGMDMDYAPADVVNNPETWTRVVQANSEAGYLAWCWRSTRRAQKPLGQATTYNDIKLRAQVWLTIIKSGPDKWWEILDGTGSSVETWAIAMGHARFGRMLPLKSWIEDTYQVTTPFSKELQIFWELSLLSLRELLHAESLQQILWPMFLNTLTHSGHTPENLPLRIIPDMVRNCRSPIPDEFWTWFDRPLFVQAFAHEKHVKPGTWSILWHAWMPTGWRMPLAVRLVELVEEALLTGHTLRLPDDLRTIWQAGPSFDKPFNILLARAMLINPRYDQVNPWTLAVTDHWLDDVEHFYPDAHFLRTFYMHLDGVSIESARSWLTQQAFPANKDVLLPPDDLV